MKLRCFLRTVAPSIFLCCVFFSVPIHGSVKQDNEQKVHSGRQRPSRKQRRQANGYEWEKGSDGNDEESFDFDATKYFQQLKESRQKPRDIIEGATGAIQTLLFGSMASVSTFVGIPVASMAVAVKSKLASITNSTQELKLVGDVAIPAVLGLIGGGIVGGISTFSIAMYSMYRATVSLWEGIMETPFAMKSWIIERRIWNPYERKWKDPRQTLEDERRELLLLIEEQEAENARKRQELDVADTTLYDLLEVSSNSSKSTIKKAYFSKAKDIHPDKNKDDPRAHERFVELHEAYSTLSDDDKRYEYDKWGYSSQTDGEINPNDLFSVNFDANLFIAILFSNGSGSMTSPIVENFVGDLAIASFLDKGVKLLAFLQGAMIATEKYGDNNNIQEKIQRFGEELDDTFFGTDEVRRTRRSIEIATFLAGKAAQLIDPQPNNDTCENDTCDWTVIAEERFRQGVRDEAQQILHDSGFYGPTYLRIIGSSLLLETSRTLVPHGVKISYRKWSSRKEFVETLFDLWGKLSQVADLDEQAMYDHATICLPNVLRLITLFNQMDISMALREAVWKILNDPGASRSELRHRKRAIHIIGEEFTKIVDSERILGSDSGSMTDQLRSNFILAAQIVSKQAK